LGLCRKPKGTLFLLALVLSASMMPVGCRRRTPRSVWASFAVFDNIPLTALALKQGGYD
jgi:hypothetical protein